jgi:hypothetical protein
VTIEHIIVVRVRNNRIVLSTDTVRMTTKERLRWVSEKGKPFTIKFKDDKTPFGNGGIHESSAGVIQAVPETASIDAPPGAGGPGPGGPHAFPGAICHYSVLMDGLPEYDPKIVFETPPEDRRGGGGGG